MSSAMMAKPTLQDLYTQMQAAFRKANTRPRTAEDVSRYFDLAIAWTKASKAGVR